jgi:hypothetical protein
VERAQEGVLADVLGLLPADDARGNAEDDRAVALDQLLEGTQVAAPGSVD